MWQLYKVQIKGHKFAIQNQKNMRLLSLLFTVVVSVVAFAQVPTITSFSPTSGNVGATITITGTGFSTTAASNIVRFGSVRATVNTATATQLTVTVPSGSTCDFISVTVNNLTKMSALKFFPTNSTTSSFSLGSSSFGTAITLNSNAGSSLHGTTLRVIDVDDDGKPDLVRPVSNPGMGSVSQISSFKNIHTTGSLSSSSFNAVVNNPSTGTSPEYSSMAAKDFNNDGKIDVAFGDMYMGRPRVLPNNSPTFGFGTALTTTSNGFINSGDFNNDGKEDLIFTDYGSGGIKIQPNTSTTAISFGGAVATGYQTGAPNANFSVCDFDKDGKLDFYFINGTSLSIVKNTDANSTIEAADFSTAGTITLPSGTYISCSNSDLDNDGDLDIVILENSKVMIYLNNSTGTGNFSFSGSAVSLTLSNTTQNWSYVSTYLNFGDLNGDGKLDIVIPCSGNSIAVFTNNTISPLAYNATFSLVLANTYFNDVALADLNDDGKVDISASDPYNKIYVFPNNIGPTAPTISGQPTLSTTSICAGTSSGSLSITAAGATSYQWQISSNAGSTWADIPGMTGSTFPGMTMNSAGSYIFRCNAINSTGTTNSSATGTLTVNATPTLTTNPTTTLSQYCYSNPNTANGITVATSASSPSYQWQESTTAGGTFSNVTLGSGGTSATYYPSHVDVWYGGTKYYRCVVTSNGCSTTSNTKPYGVYASLTSVTIPSTANENYCINGTPNNLVMQYTGDNNLVYQWSWGSTSTGPWNNISGATATTYTPPTNAANTRYYRCNVAGTCSNTAKVSGAITVTDTYTWTGATSTNPTVAGNWNPAAVPCSGANEVIPSGLTNYPVYTNLTIDAGTTLTVNTGGRLTVTGTLTNNGTMTIESGATFVQGTSLAGSGTYNVKQFVTGAGGSTPSGRFWYMGLPINNLSRQTAFGAASASNRLWSWSESAQAWSSQITDATALSPTTGYVFRTGADVTLTFTGTSLYSADASITGLTNTTGSFDGCHLMSNPYTAYLDWDQIAAAAGTTNLSSTVTVRSYNTSNSQMVYDTYNATGSVAVQNSSYAVSKYIAPMQSFWVVVNPSTTGTLSMTKAMLTHQPTAPGLKDLTSFPAFARLNLVDGSFTDQVVVYTDAEANAELEAFDSKKFFLPNVAQVYCKVGNDKLVINALKKGKAQTSAPLTVELPSTKVYKFEMAESFVDNGLVILEDRQEGIFQDMGINPTYEFFGNSGVIADRFVLHFQLPNGASNEGQAGVEDLTSSQIAVISNQNGSILVSLSADLTATGEVQVLDAAGRLIQTTAIKGQDTKLQITEGTGVYFVRVSTPMKSETKKVLVY